MGINEVIVNNPFLSMVILSLIITTCSTLIHKWLTNQEHMRSLKKRQKEIQKELKKNKDPKIMQELSAETMQITLTMLKSSYRPLLVIIVPIFFIIGWANANIAYEPLMPDIEYKISAYFKSTENGNPADLIVPEEISVVGNKTQIIENKKAIWNFRGEEGKYLATVSVSGEKLGKEVLITSNGVEYAKISESCGWFCSFKPDKIKRIELNNVKRIYLNLFGWKLGWLGTYIIFSIFASIILRRVFKVA